jgi:hypothetical protein
LIIALGDLLLFAWPDKADVNLMEGTFAVNPLTTAIYLTPCSAKTTPTAEQVKDVLHIRRDGVLRSVMNAEKKFSVLIDHVFLTIPS